MAATPSSMLPLGMAAPSFRLPDLNPLTNAGREVVALDDFRDQAALLVMFICNHCPYVKHVRQGISSLARDLQARGGAVVAINANDVSQYPDDGPAGMAAEARGAEYTFPYLFDESQEVAKSYRAACTPDFYLFDRGRRLVYRGQMDDSRPGNEVAVTGADLRAAVDAVLAGRPVPAHQKPSIGCNIKWRSGNEPEYFHR